jgi:hypothetical protein
MRMTPERMAGITYLVPVVAMGAIWYALLFVGNPPGHGPEGFLRFAFADSPERMFFWWLALLPALCLLLAFGYFSAAATKIVGAITMLGIGIAVALAAWFTLDWTIATFATMPLLFSGERVKWHLTHRSSGP